jgi:hypothetical protein
MAKMPSPPQKQAESDADNEATVLFPSEFYLSSQSLRFDQTHDKIVTSNPYRVFAIDLSESPANFESLKEHDSVVDFPTETCTG